MNALAQMPTRDRPKVDPRMSKRRQEVRRENGRRRLRRVLVLLGIVGVVILGIIIIRSPLFDLETVEISGANRTDVQDVLAVAGLDVGEPLMDADIRRAKVAVSSLPWIFTAEVSRQWPDTVSIDIVERQPVANLPSNGDSFAVVDRFGRVLERVANVDNGLPVVQVPAPLALPGEDVPEAVDAVRVASAMPRGIAPWVERIGVDGETGVVLDLVDNGRALVGDSENLNDKYVALATVLTRVQLQCANHIDVRVAQTPVLTRRAGCS